MQRTAVLPRSRFGCTACREKHRKCDEQRPSCGPCEKRGLQCDYTTTLKWASPGGINSFDKSYPRRNNKDRKRADSAKNGAHLINFSSTEQRESDLAKQDSANPRPSSLETSSSTQAEKDSLANSSHGPTQGSSPLDSRQTSVICSPISESSSPGISHRHSRDGSRSHITPSFQKSIHAGDLSEEVDKIQHEHKTGSISDAASLDETPSPHSFSSWVVDSTLSSLLNQIFDSPGEEIAFAYFFKHVCSVIPAYDGPQNPYRKLAIVALSYPVLLHGILAVSTAYMYNHGRSHAHVLSLRQSRALNSLQLAINALQAQKDKDGPESHSLDGVIHNSGVFSILSAKEITLAAVTMQTCSVLMSGVGVFEDHVKCALHFIQDLGLFYNKPNTVFVWLLVYRFATVDVLLALLRFRSPIAPLDFFMYQPNEQLDDTEPRFREMMGLSQRVLCFLAKVSVLSEEMMKTNGSKAPVHAKAHSLETEMRSWGQHYYDKMMQSAETDTPPALPSTSPEGTVDAKATLEIVCEAHYWIANLLLMRRVFFDATKSVRVQMVRQYLFRLMDQLPAGCGVDSCLPFPFYIAAREAVAPKDRDWVRRKHAAYMDFYRHQSRIAIMEAVEEIWKQSDSLDGCDIGDAPLWESPKERFIRDMDKSASYFMF